MHRVIFALLGVAAGFAAQVIWLELARHGGGTLRAATGVFLGVLTVGFPLLYYCCKRGLWEVWRFVLLGTSSGMICALPFAGGSYGFGFLLAIFALSGSLFGLLFWLAAIWRNDALTCPKSFCLPCGVAYKVARNALNRRKLLQSK
ncbi:MAG: hypothetical protein AB1642_01065 [Pseudomonadota bacterium]